MENIRNYKTNCKVNFMNFCTLQNQNQSRYYQQKSDSQRNKKMPVKR